MQLISTLLIKNYRMTEKKYYPIFLNLKGTKCVIVGGGRVAERKCSAIMRTGAMITVISPKITGRITQYKEKGLIRHLRRNYRSGDIKSAFIVIAATGSLETNKRIAEDAISLNKLLNVVDTPSLCNFIVPSVFNRGMLTIAISTGGASPALAKVIRKELQRLYGPEYSGYLKLLKIARSKVMKGINSRKEREKVLKGIVSAIRKGNVIKLK